MDLDRPPYRPTRRHARVSQPVYRLLASALVCLASIALFVPTAFAQAAESQGPAQIDVVFVLDNSGSMKTNDPEFLTRRAVADFADALAGARDVDGRVGIVLFDGDARLVQRLAPASDIASTRGLELTLAELDFSGQRTNSPAGIERALYEIRERGRADARRAIIFLSDGRIDTGDPARDFDVAAWLREDLAGASREEGVLIFGVAFTEGADYQLMQELSRRTDAQYYRAFAPGELITVVDDVLARLATPNDYALATADIRGSADGARGSADGAGASAGAPAVAAAPLADSDSDGFSPGLLGWIPALLFLAGAGLLLRGRLAGSMRTSVGGPAPPAQLLDLGGHVGEAGQAYALSAERTAIGRDPHNDIVLLSDTISSEHALIEYREGRYWLQDLRSTNGTRRAGVRLEPDERVPLKGGDAVRFADIELMFAMKGYVPIGATAYLSSSTVPPANWTALSHTTGSGAARPSSAAAAVAPAEAEAVAAASAAGDEASAADEDVDPADAPSGEVEFAEQRVRIDPASVVDLDEELGEATPQSEAGAPAAPEDTFARVAIARAEAVLEDLDGDDAYATPAPVVSARSLPAASKPVRSEPDAALTGQTEDDALDAPERASHPVEEGDPEGDVQSAPDEGPLSIDEDMPTARISFADVPTYEPTGSERRTEPRADFPHADEEITVPGGLDAGEPKPTIPGDAGSEDEAQTVPGDFASKGFGSEDAEPTIPGDDEPDPCLALRRGLDFHLARVAELSPAFASFVDEAFKEEIREALPIAANDLISAAAVSGRIEERRYSQARIRFLICGVAGDMSVARDAFVAAHGGFTRLLMEELQSEAFRSERCRILAILTCGRDPAGGAEPWVSLSVVPDEGEDPRIDLLSYEFLTDAERQEIEPNIDPEVSQSGLA